MLGNLPQSYDELYVSFYIKFQPDWAWRTVSTPEIPVTGSGAKFFRVSHEWFKNGYFRNNKDGNHFPILFLDMGANGYYGQPAKAQLTLHPRFQSTYGGSSYGSLVVPIPYYLKDGNWDFERAFVGGGSAVGGDKTFSELFGDGQWHNLKIRLKGNSAMGVEDGVWELWIDGVPIASRNNIAWADSQYDVTCPNCIKRFQRHSCIARLLCCLQSTWTYVLRIDCFILCNIVIELT